MIGAPKGRRLLVLPSERDAALAAEKFLRRLPAIALPVPIWVQCADPSATRRLTDYLVELQAELVSI